MERAISEMEKIKRAEEIYSRRRNSDYTENKTQVKQPKSIYKILFQFIVLINIAIIIVAFQNREYIFSVDFINKMNEYNINLKEKFEGLLTANKQEDIEKQAKNETESQSKSNVENQESQDNQNGQNNQSDQNNQDNSNGQVEQTSSANVEQAILVENEAPVQLSQMELDVNEISRNFSFILPINGTKTSGFGERESSNPIVTPNHTGVDIAASKGTVIKSATSGKVTQVSSQGAYGKHLRVSIGDLTVLYAHCNKIYVSEGQEVSQGQDIAEVGSTGNSTGPHLHFEVIYQDRLVDPGLILGI